MSHKHWYVQQRESAFLFYYDFLTFKLNLSYLLSFITFISLLIHTSTCPCRSSYWKMVHPFWPAFVSVSTRSSCFCTRCTVVKKRFMTGGGSAFLVYECLVAEVMVLLAIWPSWHVDAKSLLPFQLNPFSCHHFISPPTSPPFFLHPFTISCITLLFFHPLGAAAVAAEAARRRSRRWQWWWFIAFLLFSFFLFFYLKCSFLEKQ